MKLQLLESKLSVMSLTELSCLEPLIKNYYKSYISSSKIEEDINGLKEEMELSLKCLETAINDKMQRLLD